jgi:ubiquinone/menaquinone biosynthesis C-methylase UbiE
MKAASTSVAAVAAAFDRMARTYDRVFTESVIGRAQRSIVRRELARSFRSVRRVLELNCGTGEDALYLSARGVEVVACDASREMIAVARGKAALAQGQAAFLVLATEQIGELAGEGPFDGVFSNFSGLNCVSDVNKVAEELVRMVSPRGRLLLCVSGRCCLWELGWYLGKGLPAKAVRRLRGAATARVEGREFPVQYPTLRQWRARFRPFFDLRRACAVGLFVPPTYVEPWARRHPGAIAALLRLDRRVGAWPLLRGLGDHLLLEFERVR